MQMPQAWLLQVLSRTSLPNVVHLYALPVVLSAEVRSGIWALPPICGLGRVSHLPQLLPVPEGAATAMVVSPVKARIVAEILIVSWADDQFLFLRLWLSVVEIRSNVADQVGGK